jgi:hypothetical protein
MEFFIAPTKNIDDPSSLEWKHYANLSKDQVKSRWFTPMGKGLLNSLRLEDFSREAFDKHVGKIYGKFDLRGIPLQSAKLDGKDLANIDFFFADFSGSSLARSNLSGSYLSECNLKGAILDWSTLDDALLDNVQFDNKTSFLGVDLHKVNFTLATLLYDLALTQQRIQQLEQRNKIFSAFLRISCDYGRSFSQYLLWVLTFVLCYAVAYYLLMDTTFIDSLYFSIVTFATVGYGDILPHTPTEKILVISEIIIGYLMGGLLIAILAKRVIG